MNNFRTTLPLDSCVQKLKRSPFSFLAPAALAALCLYASVPANADDALHASIHFAPAENLERIDVALLARALRTIDIAAYVLTDIPVIEALEAASRRGVKVRLYMDGDGRNPGPYVTAAQSRLATASNVEERYKTPGPSCTSKVTPLIVVLFAWVRLTFRPLDSSARITI